MRRYEKPVISEEVIEIEDVIAESNYNPFRELEEGGEA